MSRYRDTKTFLLKDAPKIGQKMFLLLVKLKTLFRGHTQLVTWMVNQLLEVFMKKNWKKLGKKNLEYEKYLKEKVINCTSNGKDTITHLIVGLIKKNLYKNDSRSS